jgi:hypothetical protein
MKCSVANPIKLSIFFISALLWLSTGIAAAQEWSDWKGASGGVRIGAGLRDHVQNAAKHTVAVSLLVLDNELLTPQVKPESICPRDTHKQFGPSAEPGPKFSRNYSTAVGSFSMTTLR